MFRHMKTTQEKRNYPSDQEIKMIRENYPYAKLTIRRAARCPASLPDLYDDKFTPVDKCWKDATHRDHQYKPVYM